VWAIIQAAGWPIWPLLIASVLALGIIFERFFALRLGTVAPPELLSHTQREYRSKGASPEVLTWLESGPLVGEIFAAALRNAGTSPEIMHEAVEEAGRRVAHQLSHFLTTLGTIASISPYLGLLGTVIGMVEIFAALTPQSADPAQLAHGISVALYNTAMGLIVAIPSLIFYRHYRARVDALVLEMEQQAVKLVEVLRCERH
jgi:biopolymer transport protein ExbB